MKPFVLFTFKVKRHYIQLVLPETWQATSLFAQLQKNHQQFLKYLKWINNVDSIQKEAASIKISNKKW